MSVLYGDLVGPAKLGQSRKEGGEKMAKREKGREKKSKKKEKKSKSKAREEDKRELGS
jgi:hypothetical protein